MATKKYVSLEKLGIYDGKIKALIDSKDAAALQLAKDYADGLAVNYEKSGAAATALQDAKTYADGKDAAIQAAQKAADDAATAAGVADGKAVDAQNAVDALDAYVGEFTHDSAKTVVEYINAKTDGIATSGNLEALGTRVTAVEGDVATIKGDYLKATDKTALEGQISAVQGAVDAEAERAAGVEGGLETRLKAVEDDYLTSEDKKELQGNIDTLTGVVETLRDGIDAEKVDGVKDLIAYVEEHGTEVTGMKEDIAQNASDIDAVEGRMGTAEGKITAVEGAVATKAEKTYVDEQVQALQGVDSGLDTRLKAVESAVGESGSVADDIATAKQEAIDAAAGDATTKANTAESNAKTYADGLNTSMNTRVEALEAVDHEHGNKELLDSYTQTEANLADAVAKKHAHSNFDVLETITAAKVAAWDAAEQAAKTYADGLNTAMDTRMTAVETWQANMVEVSEEDINGLFV